MAQKTKFRLYAIVDAMGVIEHETGRLPYLLTEYEAASSRKDRERELAGCCPLTAARINEAQRMVDPICAVLRSATPSEARAVLLALTQYVANGTGPRLDEASAVLHRMTIAMGKLALEQALSKRSGTAGGDP